jgi:nitrate reductase gamma subunit
MMSSLVYVVIYACAAVFAAGCVIRAIRYARMPMHLRWELYPVPHEPPDRAAHGGSYFEQLDWWTRPRHTCLFGEIKAMLAEIVLLKGVWEHNRKLWFRSFPFHFGIYLVTAAAGLLAVSAVWDLEWLHYVYLAAGALGTASLAGGAGALLVRRLRDPEVRPYTTAGDVIHLAAFVVTFAVLAAGYLLRPDTLSLRRLTHGILTFDGTIEIPPVLAAGLILAALLAAYIPMTQMSHFIGKYFTYHSVRWDDEPSARGGPLETKLAGYLGYRPAWSAPHIVADGTKTWADIAATNPARQEKK